MAFFQSCETIITANFRAFSLLPSPKAPFPVAATHHQLLLTPFFSINTFMHPFNLWSPMFLSLGTLLSIKICCRSLTGIYSLNIYLLRTCCVPSRALGAVGATESEQPWPVSTGGGGEETCSDAERSPMWKVLEKKLGKAH